MKKFHKSISFFLAASVVLTMLCLSGCNKSETSETETSSSSITENTTESTTVESTTAESTTESETSESTTVETTTAETSEPTESTTEPSSTSAPDEGSSSGVKVHWDEYEESNHPAPVVQRLREEWIDDFIPSSDYGYVMPFCAARGEKQYEDDDEIATKYGFIDAKGQLICDGVFSDCYNSENGYIVVKNVPDPSGEGEIQLEGFISKDGSLYTGSHYNCDYSDGDYLYLSRFTSSTLSYVTLDITSCKLSEEKTLKIDGLRNSEGEFGFLYVKIAENRYVIAIGEDGIVIAVCDGKTGKKIDITVDEEGDYPRSFFLNTFYVYHNDWINEANSKGFLYSATGELLYEFKEDEQQRISKSDILVRTSDSIVVLDKNGKTKSTFSTNNHAPIKSIHSAGDYLLLSTEESLEIYDIQFKHIRSIPDIKAGHYEFIYDDVDRTTSMQNYVRPYDDNGNPCTYIIDISTGKKTEIGDGYCSVISHSSYVLVFSEGESYSFTIVDTKDGSVVFKSEKPVSRTESFYDEATNKAYVLLTETADDSIRILDLSSGQILFNGEKPIPSGFSFFTAAFDGSFLCTNNKRETCMIDRDGKITFLYYPMTLED